MVVSIMLTYLLVSCKDSEYEDMDALLNEIPTSMSADEALAIGKKNDYVIFEDGALSHGEAVWDAFYEKVLDGEPATVKTIQYYTLDKDRVSAELYEKEKDQYPKAFVRVIGYNGKTFYHKTRMTTKSELDSEGEYQYLVLDEGKTETKSVSYSYKCYILSDSLGVTRDKYFSQMLSSSIPPNEWNYRALIAYTDIRDYVSKNADS